MIKFSIILFSLVSIVCLSAFVSYTFFPRSTKGLIQAVLNTPSPEPSYSYPSIRSIFDLDHTWTATLSADKKVTLIATGDIIPARSVNYKVITRNNPLWPYEKTAEFTKDADVTFINLETPLIKKCLSTVDGMIFCGTDRNVEGLVAAGVDIASLANNHAGNYGKEGVDETVELLTAHNISAVGVNGPVYQTIKGVRFAFLGYNDITKVQPGVENAEKELIKKEIHDARDHADIIIVTYHWGVEYRNQPDDDQKDLGHFTIDSGADLVIGNHPHWIQPIEFYHGKLITYAHGNFVFDQMWSLKTRQGVVGRYIFYNKKLVDVEYFPVQIEDYGQPFFLEGADKKQVLQDMKNESISLSTSIHP